MRSVYKRFALIVALLMFVGVSSLGQLPVSAKDSKTILVGRSGFGQAYRYGEQNALTPANSSFVGVDAAKNWVAYKVRDTAASNPGRSKFYAKSYDGTKTISYKLSYADDSSLSCGGDNEGDIRYSTTAKLISTTRPSDVPRLVYITNKYRCAVSPAPLELLRTSVGYVEENGRSNKVLVSKSLTTSRLNSYVFPGGYGESSPVSGVAVHDYEKAYFIDSRGNVRSLTLPNTGYDLTRTVVSGDGSKVLLQRSGFVENGDYKELTYDVYSISGMSKVGEVKYYYTSSVSGIQVDSTGFRIAYSRSAISSGYTEVVTYDASTRKTIVIDRYKNADKSVINFKVDQHGHVITALQDKARSMSLVRQSNMDGSNNTTILATKNPAQANWRVY